MSVAYNIKPNSQKRMLCINSLNNKTCNYGDKCMYAHSVDEQRVDPIRHKVYTVLKSDYDLSNINLVNDKKLLNTLVQLSKVCYYCSKNICQGGYNCRNGATDSMYKVCYNNLMYDNCDASKCGAIHLTDRGLIPYYTQVSKQRAQANRSVNRSKDIINTNNRFKCIAQSEQNSKLSTSSAWSNPPSKIKNSIMSNNEPKLTGVLLTDKFFMKTDSSNDTDSEISVQDIEDMKRYLAEDTDAYDESIFLS